LKNQEIKSTLLCLVLKDTKSEQLSDIVQKNGTEIIGGERYRLYLPSGDEDVDGRSRDIVTSSETVIYPNPTSGSFTIKAANPIHNYKAAISNVMGELIFSCDDFESELQVDARAFGVGLYLVTIENKVTGEIESKKLIVQE
jgi:hypothetical protein